MFATKKAFEIEKKRQEFAKEGDIENLLKLYKKDLPEIKDLNTSRFWDERYESELSLNAQDPMTRKRIKIISDLIPDHKIKLLDIGAGFGWIEEIISKRKNLDLFANDISNESIEYLKNNFKGNFSKQSIYNLKYKKNFFDVVLLLEVLEHVPPSKTFLVLKSINSLLKKGGIFIISVPMNEGLEEMKENPNGHVRMYTEDLIKKELEISGFQVRKFNILYAFRNLYEIKSIFAKVLHTHKPNNIILLAIKK